MAFRPANDNWNFAARNHEAESVLQKELGVGPLAASLLVSRGFEDPETAERFLKAPLEGLHDPTLLPDYAEASRQILAAKENGETIFVHGDYDADGVTSTALLVRFLTKIGCKVTYKVPHRFIDGYGVHPRSVQEAHTNGASMLLTCDCGVASHEAVQAARDLGMRVVVTDHHAIKETLPNAHAVVNPHRTDSKYPFDDLCGVGIAFRLCEGLAQELDMPISGYRNAYLDLAVIGTIADVMSLTDENRIISKHGLARLATTNKVGLQALIAESRVKDKGALRGFHVGYMLSPRLNAAGRIDDAGVALELLLEKDPDRAKILAVKLEQLNSERKELMNRMADEAIESVRMLGIEGQRVIVVVNEDWHEGIVGLVASRIVEEFRRPAFVGGIRSDGTVKGSARSIGSFHLAAAIQRHHELFLSGGGHAAAAGFTADISNIDKIIAAMNQDAESHIPEDGMEEFVSVDVEIDPDDITLDSVRELDEFEPFGPGNRQPVFCARSMEVTGVKPTRNPKIVQVFLRSPSGRSTFKSVDFDRGEQMLKLRIGSRIDVAFCPSISTYIGESVEWTIKAHRELH